MAKAGCERHHEAHMGRGKLVQGVFVAMVLPAYGQGPFLPAFEEGRVHRRPHETALDPGNISHAHPP